MPELIEVEMYRQDLDVLVGGLVDEVLVHDDRVLRPQGVTANHLGLLVGERLTGTTRHGKVLRAHFGAGDNELVLGIRFAMTGRLLIDGESSIDQLEYASTRNDPAWNRFGVAIGGHSVILRDQRCLGSVELDPDLSFLGPEASTVSTDLLNSAFAGRTKAIKAALLDQSVLAGLGNLLADEILWIAGISPLTPVDQLDSSTRGDLAGHIRETVASLTATGGSNTGQSFPVRHAGATCPRCGGAMQRDSIGGRSSWWCPTHQH